MAQPKKQTLPSSGQPAGNPKPAPSKMVQVTIASRNTYRTGHGASVKEYGPGDKVTISVAEAARLDKLGILAKKGDVIVSGTMVQVAGDVKIGFVGNETSGEAPAAPAGMTSKTR